MVIVLATACGSGSLPVDLGSGDVVEVEQPDSLVTETQDPGVGTDDRDTAMDDKGTDPGQCECDKDVDCEPLFPGLGQCEKAYCDPATCACVAGDAKDGTACNDGEDCTEDDACKAGQCVAGLNVCDCAKDEDCAQFEDGNLCNGTLVCDMAAMPTVCIVDDATVIQCNDDIQMPCKTKECLPGTGECVEVNAENGKACEDGNECTENDACEEGECTGAHTVICDDTNLCTVDACVFGKGCVFTPVDCDDGNVCTVEPPCEAAVGCVHEPDDDNPDCVLVVEFDTPARAVTLNGEAALNVTGHVVSPAGGVASLNIWHNGWLDGQADGVQFNETDGTFTLDVASIQGLNLLQAEVEDVLGRKDRAVRSYYYSPAWYSPQSLVADGIMGFLGPEALDDDDLTDLDDVATLLVLLAENFDPLAYLTNPVTTQSFGGCEFQVNLLDLDFDAIDVDIVPQQGGVVMSAVVTGVKAPVYAPATGTGCVDINGTLVASSVSVSLTLNVSLAGGGEPMVSVTDTAVEIQGFALEPDCAPYCSLVEPVRLVAQAMAIVEINSRLPPVIEGGLKATVEEVFDTSLFISGGWPKALIGFEAGFSSVEITDAGVVVGVAGGFSSDDLSGYPVPGSIGRAQCLAAEGDLVFPNAGPMEIALHDDLLNQVPFAFHRYGAFKFPASDYYLQQQAALLASAGLTDVKLAVEALLPPLATSCNPMGLECQIGDVLVDADMKVNGSPVKARLHISLAAGVTPDVTTTISGELISLDLAAPHVAAYDLEILEGDPSMTANEFEQLLDTALIPGLKDVLDDMTESYLVPVIDLNYYVTTYLAQFIPAYFPSIPPGTTLDMTVDDLLRSVGHFVLTGSGQ